MLSARRAGDQRRQPKASDASNIRIFRLSASLAGRRHVLREPKSQVNDDHAIVNEAAERYAEALFELAAEAKTVESVEADLVQLKEMLRESADLKRVAMSPLYEAEEKAAALTAVAEKAGFNELTRKFLDMAAKNRRARELSDIIAAFAALAAAARGAVRANAVTATELTDADMEALKESLKKALGRDVEIDAKVDPSLIAGLKVMVGSRLFDSSLKSRLQGLRAAMKEA